ncbi:MAG TPA: Rieske 2Fe-2S domain-containing protein, partial [Opitutaceae bacterium]|nr:Rieske 2Fe-2S domain-containing protein [Opitutaceae bacterium]
MSTENWQDVGSVEELSKGEVNEVLVGRAKIAVTFKDGAWGAVSGVCNHVGGPLGQGHCDGDYLVCPWHNWKFHRATGLGEPGYEEDAVPSHAIKVENGRVLVNTSPASPRKRKPHAPHPLARAVKREPGEVRVAGISTTAMDPNLPRYSTSEALLEVALDHAKSQGLQTRLIKLRDLKFRSCEGYYSKSARACTWPCSITQADPGDELTAVYEAIVHWADVIIMATPIRWGQASSLYFKMAERL